MYSISGVHASCIASYLILGDRAQRTMNAVVKGYRNSHIAARISYYLENLFFDASVSAHMRKGQQVQAGQQQLHVRQEGFEAAHVVVAQGRVQTWIEARLLRLCGVCIQ